MWLQLCKPLYIFLCNCFTFARKKVNIYLKTLNLVKKWNSPKKKKTIVLKKEIFKGPVIIYRLGEVGGFWANTVNLADPLF